MTIRIVPGHLEQVQVGLLGVHGPRSPNMVLWGVVESYVFVHGEFGV